MIRVHEYRLYYRADPAHGDSLVKIEVGDGRRWLEACELRRAFDVGDPVDVGAMLRALVAALSPLGMADAGRLLARKQVFLPRRVGSFDEIRSLGWEVFSYPRKFVPQDAAACLSDARSSGIAVDASNVIKNDSTAGTRGLAMKAAVDLLSAGGVPFCIYADWNLWGRLRAIGGEGLYDYMMGFARTGTFGRVFTARPEDPHCRGQADPLMLHWAARSGMHVLSRDEFDEFDLQYDFVMHGADWGRQRLHKFRCENGVFSIPDLGLSGALPAAF